MEQRQRSIFKLCCLAVVLLSVWTMAQEARVGILVHDVAPLFGANKIEGGFDLNGEIIMGLGLVRPMVGISVNSRGQTSCAYCGLAFVYNTSHSFVSVGVGGAAQVNAIRNLGSTVLFRLSLEVGYKRFSVLLAHLSNGAGFFWWDIPNAGVDTLGIRYAF